MSFKKALINNIIDPEKRTQFSNTTGTVISYDKENNRADVFISIAPGKTESLIKGVPIQIAANGIHQANLREGDYVYIQYSNSSYFQPKIIGVADETYYHNTRLKEKHLRKGTLSVSEIDFVDIDKENYTPSSAKWLDIKNTNEFKTFEYKDRDPIEELAVYEEDLGFFNGTEVGIVNPTSSSIIKAFDNGDIHIFTDNNIGLKINTKERTIEQIGNSINNKCSSFKVIGDNITFEAKEQLELNFKKIIVNGEIKHE